MRADSAHAISLKDQKLIRTLDTNRWVRKILFGLSQLDTLFMLMSE